MGLSAQEGLNTCCKTITHSINSLNMPSAYNQNKNNNLLGALQSPQNLQGADGLLLQTMREAWGKKSINGGSGTCKFKIWVEKPTCGSVSETEKLICNNSNTTAPSDTRLEYDVTIDEVSSAEGYITLADFLCLCNGTQSEVVQRQILQKGRDIIKNMNTRLVTKVQSEMGAYSNAEESTTNTKTLNLFNDFNGTFGIQTVGWSPMLLEYEKMQTQGGVLAVGGDIAFQYIAAQGLTRLVTGGYQLPQGVTVFFDPDVNAIADQTLTNPLLTWAPGALVLLRYMDNWNVAENHINGANIARSIISIDGVDMDLVISTDPSCEKIRWVLNASWDLFALPSEVWADCVSTNQRQLYNIGCDPYDCGQIAPPAAVS